MFKKMNAYKHKALFRCSYFIAMILALWYTKDNCVKTSGRSTSA